MSTVVVIDEDGPMRALICEWLEGARYAVDPVGGSTAVEGRSEVGLVIVDIPNLRFHGPGTVRGVRERYPHAAIIGMSTQLGRSLPGNSVEASAMGVGRLIAKPLTRDELLAAVVDSIGVAA